MPTPVGDLLAGDDHGLGGWRVTSRIVQQVSEDQREVVHQTAVDTEFRQVTDLDTVEVLDPSDAATHHAEQSLRLLPLPSRPVRAPQHTDTGRETVGGADLLVQLHEPLGHRGQSPVLALHLCSRPRSLLVSTWIRLPILITACSADVERSNSSSTPISAVRRTLRNSARSSGPASVSPPISSRCRRSPRRPATVSAHRADTSPRACPRRPAEGRVAPPVPGLRSNAALVGLRLLGEPSLETPGLFSQFRVQAGALSREIPLQARRVLLPLPGELGLRGAEVLVGTP